MTISNLSEMLRAAKPNRPPRKTISTKARKVRGLSAYVLMLPGGCLIWTSSRLVEAWPGRQAGEFLHPALSACAGSA